MATQSTAKRRSEPVTADVAVIRTPAEEAILGALPGLPGPAGALGRLVRRAAARRGVRRAQERTAEPPRRGVEVHRPARADAGAAGARSRTFAPAMVEAARRMRPALAMPEAIRFLFVNGRDFATGRRMATSGTSSKRATSSLPAWREAVSRASAPTPTMPLVALNSAFHGRMDGAARAGRRHAGASAASRIPRHRRGAVLRSIRASCWWSRTAPRPR